MSRVLNTITETKHDLWVQVQELTNELIQLTQENAELKDILTEYGYYKDNQYTDRDREIDRDLQNIQAEQDKLDDDKKFLAEQDKIEPSENQVNQ